MLSIHILAVAVTTVRLAVAVAIIRLALAVPPSPATVENNMFQDIKSEADALIEAHNGENTNLQQGEFMVTVC